MVILLSALAVVAAAVLLVAWFLVGGGFTLIYAAMGLAVASMVLLWLAKYLGSTVEPAASVAPAQLAEEIRVEIPIRDEVDEVASRGAFPIADYEHLWVTQILPLLPELDDGELAVVEARERGARHRGGVLDAIDAERAARRGAPAAVPAPVAADASEGEADVEVEVEAEPVATVDVEAEPVAAVEAEAEAEEVEVEVEVDVDVVEAADEVEAEEEAVSAPTAEADDDGDPFARAWRELAADDALGGGDELDRSVLDLAAVEADDDIWTHDDPAPADERPVADPEVVALDAGAAAPERELVGTGAGGPARVRTFLGRVSAPITVDHAPGDRLP